MTAATNTGESLPAIARASVTKRLTGVSSYPTPEPAGYLAGRAGVFVTIHTHDGELRGCRGTLEPQFSNLVEETRQLALSSALQDTRFQPVSATELIHLHFEVSVLHPPTPATGLHEVDPSRHGIIVRTPDGRCALMLPGVDGLDTAEQQFLATCHKGRINPKEELTLERFVVDKFEEPAP